MSKAKDPIFAPVTYGDDRQVTRTRRGVHCEDELLYNPNVVYLRCHRCRYRWTISLNDYTQGFGTHLQDTPNFGIGGTGSSGIWPYWEYGRYDELAHDCCTGGVGMCDDTGKLIPISTFYPYTGGTGDDGLPTGGTGGNGEWTGGIPHPFLGDATTIYRYCAGGSGSASHTGPKTFGGYPLVCPNCCRVNFSATFMLPNDAPGPQEIMDSSADFHPRPGFCNVVIVIDFQRIKSDIGGFY